MQETDETTATQGDVDDLIFPAGRDRTVSDR